MALENPFMLPRQLDGTVPDVTQARGWADAENPTRLTRFSMVGERMIGTMLAGLSLRADDQYGTDQIPLNAQEELFVEASKGMSDLEAEAGVFGADQVLAERLETLKQGLAPHRPMELTPMAEELPRE